LKNGTCGLSYLVLGVDGLVWGNSSRAVLPLTRHQCSIHCESSRVAHGERKQRWATHRPLVLRKEYNNRA